jgi:muconate cycloisomerase
MSDSLAAGLDIFRTSLPMRTFEHATARREVAEAILVHLRLREGAAGWGEALPRPYVTGETMESVIEDIERIFWPLLAPCRTREQFHQAVLDLPCRHENRIITAARCAVELAAAGALGLEWGASGQAAAMGQGRGQMGAIPHARAKTAMAVRVSGVIGSSDARKTARQLRLMRLYGLRSFKLKLGFDEQIDRANLEVVTRRLKRGLAAGKVGLRVDVNGAWSYGQVVERVAELKKLGVLAVEQPCKASAGRLVELAMRCELPLIADESCLTEADAEVLLGAEGRVWMNLRLGKNGGLGPTLRLARLAAREEIPYVLGCMVGESGLLATAQRVFLRAAPPPVLLEGNYGRFLLRDDLTDPSPRFGYAGKLMLPAQAIFHPNVRPEQVSRYGQIIKSL